MASTSVPQPLQRRSLVDQAIEALRVHITAGTWPVGERIPTEPELVASLGVGRNTVREATRALVHAGLLETRQGDGTYVRATSELAGALRRRAGHAALLEVFEVRRALELEAVCLAAQRRTDADLARVQVVLDERSARWAAGDVEGFVEQDAAFHAAIAAASHNEMLRQLYDDFGHALRDAIRETLTDATLPEGDHTDEHVDLVEAIRAGDADRARAVSAAFLDMHLDALRKAVGE